MNIGNSFYKSNKIIAPLEAMIKRIDTLEEFEQKFSDEFLDNDDHIPFLCGKYCEREEEKSGQAPLYVRRKRDVIIWFGFMKKMSLDEVDAKLRERGYKPLFRT